jgi:hypothetical protein
MATAHPFDLTNIVEDVGSLKQQVKTLQSEFEAAKKENSGWIKKWGLYLGVLASIVAIPTAAKKAMDSWYEYASLKIQEPDNLTLTLDSERSVVVFSFPVTASNIGTGEGYVTGGGAHLEPTVPVSTGVSPKDVAGESIKFYDESKSIQDRPVYVSAHGTPRLLTAYLDFGKNGITAPGWYRLSVTLNNEKGRALLDNPVTFCFHVTPSQIENLRTTNIVQAYCSCQSKSRDSL